MSDIDNIGLGRAPAEHAGEAACWLAVREERHPGEDIWGQAARLLRERDDEKARRQGSARLLEDALVAAGLEPEQVERAMQPLLSFHAQLAEEMQRLCSEHAWLVEEEKE